MRKLLLLALVAAACGPVARAPAATDGASEASAEPAATPSQTPARRGAPPTSAGAVADAGVLYVWGADDSTYRYDGATGKLERMLSASTLLRERSEGAYVVGRQGGVTLLRWDGLTLPIECGPGAVAALSATGACASTSDGSLYIRLADEKRARLVLPSDWGAHDAAWSPDGQRLVLVRLIAARPGPGVDPGLDALWILENDGALRELYRPEKHAVLSAPRWSPDGKYVLVWRIETTSNSMAADGAGTSALLIEVATGRVTELGIVLSRGWAQWSIDGRLAFVNGGDRMTWTNKQLVVRERDGRLRLVRAPTDEKRVALAPAWDPARGRLAWVSGPDVGGAGDGGGYVDGDGGGRRVAVVDDGVLPFEVTCGDGRVVEGVRWSADGSALLLLCRKTGRDAQPLELWLHRMTDGTNAALVTGLVGGPLEAGGFGFYGAQPSLVSLVAWSR